MLRTARLTEAMRAHGKTMAVAAAAAGVLAGAGSASAALTSSPTPATGHLAASHAVVDSHSAVTTAHLSASGKHPKAAVTPTVAFPIGHAAPAPKAAVTPTVAFPIGHAAPAPKAAVTPTVAFPIGHAAPAPKAAPTTAPAPSQAAAPAPQPAPAQAAPAAAPAQAAPAAAPAPQPAPPSTTIYDSVTASSIPAGARAAVYSDGAYAASPAQVAGHPDTLWIDTNGSNTHANVLDVEPGDATPQQAATWVQQKLTANPNDTAIVYTFRADWQPTKDAIAALPPQMQAHVKWWIADPTGVAHILPGSDATQWYWGQSYDQSLANPGF